MKRTFQPSERKREISTDSVRECQRLTEDAYWLLEELKAEKD